MTTFTWSTWSRFTLIKQYCVFFLNLDILLKDKNQEIIIII